MLPQAIHLQALGNGDCSIPVNAMRPEKETWATAISESGIQETSVHPVFATLPAIGTVDRAR